MGDRPITGRRLWLGISLIFGLAGCASNLQENRIAAPVKVDRKVVSVDTASAAPDTATLPKSSVFAQLPTPKSDESVPVTAYQRGSLWAITAYEAAATSESCAAFLREWAGKLAAGTQRRGFCVARNPQVRAYFRIAGVIAVNL